MDKDLTLALVNLSQATEQACREAKRAGNEQLFYQLRRLGWTVADLLAGSVRDEAGKVAS